MTELMLRLIELSNDFGNAAHQHEDSEICGVASVLAFLGAAIMEERALELACLIANFQGADGGVEEQVRAASLEWHMPHWPSPN